jgi:WD40 repeat protein
VRSFEEHRDEITSISVSADGGRLLSGSRDKTMILWDTPTGDPLCTLLSECGPIEHISISGDGCRALSVARIDGFEVWDLEASQRTRVIARHLDGISRACFTPDADRVASLSDRHMLIVWDVESGQPVRAMRSRSVIDDLFLSPDGRRALASEGETLVLWDLETGRELRSLRRDGASIEQVCFGPDGDSALSSYKDGALVLWNLRSGLAMTQFYTTSPATAIAWLAKRVALGDAHGVVSFWELL